MGNKLLTEDGKWVAVDEMVSTGVDDVVYNFRVADFHTYFVGLVGWGWSVWAHNQEGICFRALREDDLKAFQSYERIMPKSKGGTILDHIQGRIDTKYISVSKTRKGTAQFVGAGGVVEIDLAVAIKTGSGIVPHEQLLQVAKKHGTTRDVKNVINAEEFLITGGIHPSAIVRHMP